MPPAARGPVGKDRARGNAPPVRRKAVEPAPPKPSLPSDEEPELPRAVIKDLERALGRTRRAEEVALALSIGSQAIDEGLIDVALEMLAWARHEAGRVGAVREAYGVARYLDEDYQGALAELNTYRRITGRADQNHIIADCLRALGRGQDRVIEAASALVEDHQAPQDRRIEAAIVWAASLADGGDVGGGRAVLRRMLASTGASGEDHDLRLRSFAAELAERDGDVEEAREQLALIVSHDAQAYDAAVRLAALPTSR